MVGSTVSFNIYFFTYFVHRLRRMQNLLSQRLFSHSTTTQKNDHLKAYVISNPYSDLVK